jgi:S1-C subfamily serine protease
MAKANKRRGGRYTPPKTSVGVGDSTRRRETGGEGQTAAVRMELPEAIETVRPSIIQVSVGGVGTRSVPIGTGFLVHEDGFALTARHVTEDAMTVVAALPGAKLYAALALPNFSSPQLTMRASFELIECDVAEQDPRHDISLLKLSQNPFKSGRPSGIFAAPGGGFGVNAMYGLPRLALDPPVDGERIAVSGYPLGDTILITTSGGIASAFAMDIQETHLPGAPVGFTIPDVADSYLADVAVNPGNSGGPVYKIDTAEVIGVCVAFRIADVIPQLPRTPFSYNSGLSVVVPIRYGTELLTRHT